MNKSFKRYKIYTFTAAILAVIFSVFITVFNSSYFDFGTGLYYAGTPKALIIIPIIALILFFASSFLTLKLDDMPLRYPKNHSLLTVFASALAGISMIFTVIMQFCARPTDHLSQLYTTELEGLATASLMLKLSLVFAVLGVIYFVVIIVTNKANPLLAILSVAWILAVILRIYYDMTFIITNPVRNFTALALCAAALFLLSEIRYLSGKCSPCFFVFAASLASVFCVASGVSKTAFIFMGKTGFETESAYFFFEIAIGLYALSRLLRFTEKKAFEETEPLPFEGVSLASSVEEAAKEVRQASDTPESIEETQEEVALDTDGTAENVDGADTDTDTESEKESE